MPCWCEIAFSCYATLFIADLQWNCLSTPGFLYRDQQLQFVECMFSIPIWRASPQTPYAEMVLLTMPFNICIFLASPMLYRMHSQHDKCWRPQHWTALKPACLHRNMRNYYYLETWFQLIQGQVAYLWNFSMQCFALEPISITLLNFTLVQGSNSPCRSRKLLLRNAVAVSCVKINGPLNEIFLRNESSTKHGVLKNV